MPSGQDSTDRRTIFASVAPMPCAKLVEQQLAELAAVLETDLGRDSLHALFRGERLRVRADAQDGFRVEEPRGCDSPRTKEPPVSVTTSGQLYRMLAGERYDTVDSWRADEIEAAFPIAA